MTNQEILELALNALKCLFGLPDKFTGEGGDVAVWRLGGSYRAQEAIKALEEALAKQEQKRPQNCGTSYCSCIECVMEQEQGEPVALNRDGIRKLMNQSGYDNANPQEAAAFISGIRHREAEMLDTTPQQRKPLTSEEVKNLVVKHSYEFHTDGWGRQSFLFGRDDLIAFVKDVEIVHEIKE